MAGELVPLVMLPRYSSFAAAATTDFITIAMDVTEYERAILNLWQATMTAGNAAVYYFEESTDGLAWTECSGVTQPVSLTPGTESQFKPDLNKRWFRIRVRLTGSSAAVTCWAVGFLERRES